MTRSEILVNVFTQLKSAGIVRNKSDFARQLDYSKCYLSFAFSGQHTPQISNKLFSKILSVFPQVNEDYILTGYGNVLNADARMETATGILPGTNRRGSVYEYLMAERSRLEQDLATVNRLLAQISPRDLKCAS